MHRIAQSPASGPPRRRRACLPLAGALLLAVASFTPAWAATDWSRQKAPTQRRILDVAFANGNTGVMVGQGGAILTTADGGVNWGEPSSPVSADLRALTTWPACGTNGAPCFWAGAADGTIIVSTNGGLSWCTQQTGTVEKISDVVAVGPDEVLAVGTNGIILRSTAARTCGAAAAYQAQESGTAKNLNAVTRLPDGSTIVVGAAGTILRRVTANSPFAFLVATAADLDAVTTARGPGAGYTVYAVGEAGAILSSPDGQNWTAQASGSRWDLHDVAFPVNHLTGFAVGDMGTIVSTENGGRTWTAQTSSTCNNLFALSMLDNTHGWAVGGSGTLVVKPASGKGSQPPCALTGRGYRLVASDGGIFAFGSASFHGSTGSIRLNKPMVGMAPTQTGAGYWMVASDGGIFAFGDAGFFGSTGSIQLRSPIVGMAATPTGAGYWLVASDGGIFAFGDAKFLGSAAGKSPASPIVGMASTPTGRGYWVAAANGAIFTFGDATPFGNLTGTPLAKPIVGLSTTPTGAGYWMVATDGGIFAFGDAGFFGSTGAIKLNQPIVGMASA